jgi:OmpA-OmpF porin, OOP family
MKSIRQIAVAGVAALALSACAGDAMKNQSNLDIARADYMSGASWRNGDIWKASNVKPAGSSFTKALYKEYLDLSAFEYGEDDQTSVSAYAKRAIAAGKNKPTGPEALSARKLPGGTVGALTKGRSDLMAAFSSGAESREPGHAARAQAMFDCWMEQQEENNQPKHIAACRDGFMSALAKLKAPMAKPMPKPTPKPMPKPMAKLTGPYIVYFGFDSAKIPLTQMGIVNTAGVDAETVKPTSVIVQGHTDLAGDPKYNNELSAARVNAVIRALADAGISATIMSKSYHGEGKPAVATADGKREKKNRRVEIIFKR